VRGKREIRGDRVISPGEIHLQAPPVFSSPSCPRYPRRLQSGIASGKAHYPRRYWVKIAGGKARPDSGSAAHFNAGAYVPKSPAVMHVPPATFI
jgi:hypothetical protein